MRSFWTPALDRSFAALYPHLRSDDVARIIGRSLSAVYGRAGFLGIEKSDAYNASPLSGRNVKGHAIHGTQSRFKKGFVPWNVGTHWTAGGRSAETRFAKGHFPANRDPDYYVIGALRVNVDGYIDMRTSFAAGAKGWTGLHRVLWQDKHGAIPRTHALIFKDGDRLNVCIENLELITRADLMRRNTIHRLPKPLKSALQLLGQLKRRINEKQDRGLTGTSVRNARRPAQPGQAARP